MSLFKTLQNDKGIKGQVITELTPMINEVTEMIKQDMILSAAKQNKTITIGTHEDDMIKVGLIVDLFKAMQNYILESDQIVTLKATTSAGRIEIDADILRDGETMRFSTYAILAGGYNIQRLHVRYIVSSKLPRVSSDFTSEIVKETKRLSKIEKMKVELKNMIAKREELIETIAVNETLTDDQIIEEIKKRNSDHDRWLFTAKFENYDQSYRPKTEEVFNQEIKDAIDRSVMSWKRFKITCKKGYVKDLTKAIAKQEKKIATI